MLPQDKQGGLPLVPCNIRDQLKDLLTSQYRQASMIRVFSDDSVKGSPYQGLAFLIRRAVMDRKTKCLSLDECTRNVTDVPFNLTANLVHETFSAEGIGMNISNMGSGDFQTVVSTVIDVFQVDPICDIVHRSSA